MDVTAWGTDIMNGETNSSSRFAYDSTLLQGIIYAFNAVIFHAQKKAAT